MSLLKSATTCLLVSMIGVSLSACSITTNKDREAKFVNHPSYNQDCVNEIMQPASDRAKFRRHSKARRILNKANSRISKECEITQKEW